MALSIMADKLKELAAKKMKNLSDDEKKALVNKIMPEKESAAEDKTETTEETPSETTIKATVASAGPGDDYEGTVRKKVDDLKKMGLIGADELYKQLPSLTGELKNVSEKSDAQSRIEGGARVKNLAAHFTRNADEIADMIRNKNMKSIAEVKANKDYFSSDPAIKSMINNQFFDQLYPNFWQVVSKKAGIQQ
jgi:hypothetical protein